MVIYNMDNKLRIQTWLEELGVVCQHGVVCQYCVACKPKPYLNDKSTSSIDWWKKWILFPLTGNLRSRCYYIFFNTTFLFILLCHKMVFFCDNRLWYSMFCVVLYLLLWINNKLYYYHYPRRVVISSTVFVPFSIGAISSWCSLFICILWNRKHKMENYVWCVLVCLKLPY